MRSSASTRSVSAVEMLCCSWGIRSANAPSQQSVGWARSITSGNASNQRRTERVEALLRMAEEGWRNQGNLAAPGLIAVFRAMSNWSSGQFPRSTEYAQQALAVLPDDMQERNFQIWRKIG